MRDWPDGAVLLEGATLLWKAKGLKEGVAFRAKMFETSELKALDAAVTVGAKKDVDLLGRVVPLTEVVCPNGS